MSYIQAPKTQALFKLKSEGCHSRQPIDAWNNANTGHATIISACNFGHILWLN
jgi:hypothetical protein